MTAIVFHYIGKSMTGSISTAQFEGIVAKNPKAIFRFDDGTKEHCTKAYQVLRKRGMKGYFFPVTSAIAEKKVLVIHKIHFLLEEHMEELEAELKNTGTRKINEKEMKNTYGYETPKRAFIKYALNFVLDEKSAKKSVDKLFDKFYDEKDVAEEFYMNFDELRGMSENGMIIGSHTHTHMNALTAGRTKFLGDVLKSKNILERELRSRINAFAFPFGGRHMEETVSELKPFLQEMGFKVIFPGFDREVDAKAVLSRQ